VVEAAERTNLEESRWTLGLAAFLIVFGVLLAVYRRVERALVPLVPAVLATGWAALVVWIFQVPVNPLSVALGAILVALGAALSTLLYERYAEARASGLEPGRAVEQAWGASARPVITAAAVIGAGFLALTVSDFKLLRDFGAVTAAGLVLELVAAMLVLPAAVLVVEAGITVRAPSRARTVAAMRSARAGAGRAARAAAAGVRRATPTRK
jgi:predicted RND superfamily exporter protein